MLIAAVLIANILRYRCARWQLATLAGRKAYSLAGDPPQCRRYFTNVSLPTVADVVMQSGVSSLLVSLDGSQPSPATQVDTIEHTVATAILTSG